MMKQKIANIDTLNDIERALNEIGSSGSIALQLNKDNFSKRKGAIIDASRLQLFATWARKSPENFFSFHSSNQPSLVMDDLCDYSPGIAALRLTKHIEVGDIKIPRRESLQSASQKIENSDQGYYSKLIKGRAIDLISVSGAKLQYISPLFDSRSPESVKKQDGMFITVQKIFKEINKRDDMHIPQDFTKAASIFASELLRNTQQHALTDCTGHPFQAHVEGLISSWTQINRESWFSNFSDNSRFLDYWNRHNLVNESNPDGTLRCFQFSFFDTGPGFASRITGKPYEQMTLKDERDALIDCFKKHITSKSDKSSGEGLPLVLEELRKLSGLIRIRSGRHSIFNEFSNSDSANLLDFEDLTGDKLSEVCGSVISLLIPLRRDYE